MNATTIPSPLAGEGDSPQASGERGYTPTDQRNGVTPTQHAVLDLLAQRAPQWGMMATDELQALIERQLLDAPLPASNWPRLAAIALHLAERHHAKAFTGTGAMTDLAALGLCSVWIDGDDYGLALADAVEEITDHLIDLQTDKITPVVALETYTRGENLHAVLVPTAFDAEGHPTDHQLQFHPTQASALRARLAAFGEDHANG